MSDSITDAFKKTAKGNTQVLQIKKYHKEKDDKLKVLRSLAYSMLITTGHDYGLFKKAAPFMERICMKGTNEQYNKATTALKMFHVTNQHCSMRVARKAVVDSLEMAV